jgi:hypothetical protein
MDKKSKIIFEKLESLYEYDKEFFSFTNLIKDKWTELLQDGMKKFKIHFDLENNDSNKIQREIVIPQSKWDYVKCKFKCELCYAGGDWEIPVYYFKIQLVDGYCFNDDLKNKKDDIIMSRTKHYNSHFIYIPGKTKGNYHLISKDGKEWSTPSNNIYQKDIDPKANENDCWESLKEYLKILVEKEIEKSNENSVSL